MNDIFFRNEIGSRQTFGRIKALGVCAQMLCLFVALVSASRADDVFSPATVAQIKNGLAAAQYDTRDGAIVFSAGCDTANCNLNNPGSVYGAVTVPLSLNADPTALGATFHLGPGEAILILMKTPPSSRYFGMTSYVRLRYGVDANNNPVWKDVFASTGDSINHLTLATGGTLNGAAGNAFDQDTAIIVTADQDLDRLIRSTLAGNSVSPQIVNSYPLPIGLPLNMGFASTADYFQLLFRVAMPADPAALDAYMTAFNSGVNAPGAVIRISRRIGVTYPAPPAPFSTPPLRSATTGISEATIRPGLGQSLGALITAVKQRYGTLAVKQAVFPENTSAHGRLCLAGFYACLGDTYDATYLYDPNLESLPDDPNDFIVVVGANHRATGKAAYSNISISRLQGLTGLKAISDLDYAGSAQTYLPGDPNADFLYAFKFARHCNGEPFCFEVSSDALPLDQPAIFIERAYLDAQTKTHPAGNEIFHPMLLHFSSP